MSPGCFRATFEDMILMSDIVFLRSWFTVTVKKYYNPVTSHLLSDNWQGMRTTGEIRKQLNIPIPNKKDSHYKVFIVFLMVEH